MGNAAQTEESRRIVEAMYAAGSRGDIEGVTKCLDANVVVHEPPFLPYGGIHNGIEGFKNIFAGIAPFADLTSMKLDHVVADGERVFCVMTIIDKNTGKNLMIAEESIVRSGKIVEMRVFYFDAGSMINAKRG